MARPGHDGPGCRGRCAAGILVFLALTAAAETQAGGKFWVIFRDKGPAPAAGADLVTARALARRAKVLPVGRLVDSCDAPIYAPYLRAVAACGGRLVCESRWLNAASFTIPEFALPLLKTLPFVAGVRPVGSIRAPRVALASAAAAPAGGAVPASIDYGLAQRQVAMVNVPILHGLGITGRGVLIGMLDSGFRWRTHEALRSLRVVAEHDFVFNDDTTANQQGDAIDQDFHGTLTLSVVGGNKPGKLVGPAFGAAFALAKTEYVPTETRQEEDNWAAGIEWLEGLGADVVSSSLGYNTFDPPDSGYSWFAGDFNGRTTICARAAERACALGVVVCNAMGNEGNDDSGIGTMLTPADADTLISVGAVTFGGQLYFLSSQGPTSDGRIKPDVVAPGVGVYGAVPPGPDSYAGLSGTSLATPLVAGAAALMLSARPELTPLQVRDALRAAASPVTDPARFPLSPNNFTGWGLVDAADAALAFGPVFSNLPAIDARSAQSTVTIDVVSRSGLAPATLLVRYARGDDSLYHTVAMTLDSTILFSGSGRYHAAIPPMPYGTLVRCSISASDSAGHTYASPPPGSGEEWRFRYGIPGLEGGTRPIPAAYALEQNFPNPFNNTTRIVFDLPQRGHVKIDVFDLLGRKVVTLLDDDVEAGDAGSRAPVTFDATNLASGVYLYRITAPSFTAVRKMILIR